MGGMTALLYAAREGHMETVRALVEAGANINTSTAINTARWSMAITNGHLDVAQYLLDHGADPNLATDAGLTALYAVIDVQWAPHAWFPQPTTEQEKTDYLDLMKSLDRPRRERQRRRSTRSSGSAPSPTITPGSIRPAPPPSGAPRNRATPPP